MIHEIQDGDVVVVGFDEPLSKDDAETLKVEVADAIRTVLGVEVKALIVSQSPGLFAVLRKRST